MNLSPRFLRPRRALPSYNSVRRHENQKIKIVPGRTIRGADENGPRPMPLPVIPLLQAN